MLSILIPVFNEERNIPLLIDSLLPVLVATGRAFEIIFVNDGSSDGTADALFRASLRRPEIKIVNLARNYGQTAAMMAGIDRAEGEIIIPMDGDLQNDPADIPLLLAKLADGYDVVSGWRQNRAERSPARRMPSRIANWVISRVSGVHLHDYGCTLKAYRRDVLSHVRLYGEMHRFIPIYASWHGGRVAEIPVRHHPRRHGSSNYGLARTFKVVLDLLVVKFLGAHLTKPIHVFGGFGMLCLLAAMLTGLFALYLKYAEGTSLIQTPLPLLAALFFLTGLMALLMGILAEVQVRAYFETQGKRAYVVRNTINIGSSIECAASSDSSAKVDAKT